MDSQETEKSVNFDGSMSTKATKEEVITSNTLNPLEEDDRGVTGDRKELTGEPRWVRIRHRFREPIAEFFGVFTLIVFGDGVVAQVVLSKGQKGNYQSISWGLSSPPSFM
jgi:hypothetical protein